MVTIIENWSKISGVIQELGTHPNLQDYFQLKVILEKSQAIKGFPDLARPDEGKTIRINIPVQANIPYKKGAQFKGIVRKVFGQEYFIKLK